jgi:hypothetical protein
MPRQPHDVGALALRVVGSRIRVAQTVVGQREAAFGLLELPFGACEGLLRLILGALPHLQDGFEPKAEARHADCVE